MNPHSLSTARSDRMLRFHLQLARKRLQRIRTSRQRPTPEAHRLEACRLCQAQSKGRLKLLACQTTTTQCLCLSATHLLMLVFRDRFHWTSFLRRGGCILAQSSVLLACAAIQDLWLCTQVPCSRPCQLGVLCWTLYLLQLCPPLPPLLQRLQLQDVGCQP